MHPEVLAHLLAILSSRTGGVPSLPAQRQAGPPWPPPPVMMTPPWFTPPPAGHVPVAPSYPMGFPYFTPPPPPRARPKPQAGPPPGWIGAMFPEAHRKRRA